MVMGEGRKEVDGRLLRNFRSSASSVRGTKYCIYLLSYCMHACEGQWHFHEVDARIAIFTGNFVEF